MSASAPSSNVRLVIADPALATDVRAALVPLGLLAVETNDAAVVLVDQSDAVLRWSGKARVVVLVESVDEVSDLLAWGAWDFVVSGESPQAIARRLWLASLRTGVQGTLDPDTRRLIRHDLRGPLSVVLGHCELMSAEIGGPLSDRQRRSIEAIERQTHHLTELVDRLAELLAP